MGKRHEHHDHDHDHHHTHDHLHLHGSFRTGVILNLILVMGQIWAGLRSDSVALLADAWHNLGDVLGLLLAWVATWLASRPTTERFTYGFKSSTIWAALINSSSLMFLSGGLLWESMRRFSNPTGVNSELVMIFAALGILINGLSAIPFFKNSDLNVRAAFWHLIADALVSAAVLVGAYIQNKTQLFWIDPAMSILICLIIAIGSTRVLKEAISLAMHAVPKHIDLAELKQKILLTDGVEKIHDVHVWSLGTNDLAFTCHLVCRTEISASKVLNQVEQMLALDFKIDHVTIQVEEAGSFAECKQAPHTQ